MTGFERIVRPFQAPAITPPPVPDTGATSDDNVSLIVGKVGNGKTFNGSFSATRTFYMQAQQSEKRRATTKKRIVDPDDESNHLDVEYIDALRTTGTNGQDVVYKYKRQPT